MVHRFSFEMSKAYDLPAIGLEPPPLPSASQKALITALERDDADEVRVLLDSVSLHNLRLTEASVLALLDYAYQRQASLGIKTTLLGSPGFAVDAKHGTGGANALALAIKHNDLALADYLLRNGAEPAQTLPYRLTEPMRQLVNFWSRCRKLYPASASEQKWNTLLDQALWEGRRDEAECILETEIWDTFGPLFRVDENISTIWNFAINAERDDILRAMLALSIVDKDRAFRCEETKPPANLHIKAVTKEVPYQSPKLGRAVNYNGEVKFPTGKTIRCRHLAMHLQNQQAGNEQLKFNNGQFMSPEAIRNSVPPATHQQYMALEAFATETHMIDHAYFGQFLINQFTEMKKKGKKTKQMLIQTHNHAMTLALRIKVKDGKTSYVVKYFDPNDTTNQIRSCKTAVGDFKYEKLSNYLDADENYYYPEANGAVLAYVRPENMDMDVDMDADGLDPKVAPDRTLTTLPDKAVDGEMMSLIAKGGFTGTLLWLKDAIRGMEEHKRDALFNHTNENGQSPIRLAILKRHIYTVKAFVNILDGVIDKDKLAEWMMAKRDDGTSAWRVAFQDGDADMIKVMIDVLPSIPEDKWFPLLQAMDDRGISGVSVAMSNRRASALLALDEVLDKLNEAKRFMSLETYEAECFKLLNTYDARFGMSMLCMAFENEDVATISAYGRLLRHVSGKARVKLLADIQTEEDANKPSFVYAMDLGFGDAVKAYLDVVDSYVSELENDDKKSMLDYFIACLAHKEMQIDETEASEWVSMKLDLLQQVGEVIRKLQVW